MPEGAPLISRRDARRKKREGIPLAPYSLLPAPYGRSRLGDESELRRQGAARLLKREYNAAFFQTIIGEPAHRGRNADRGNHVLGKILHRNSNPPHVAFDFFVLDGVA